jgi:3-dehydroquinate synthase
LMTKPPTRGPRGVITPETLIAHMTVDKKVQDGAITFVLARGIGQAFTTADVPREALRATLAQSLS